MQETQTGDQIMREIHQIKENLGKKQNFDVKLILNDARNKQNQSSHKIILKNV